MRISASEPAQVWLRGLPPASKSKVRRALKGLATGKEKTLDTKPLRGELEALVVGLGGVAPRACAADGYFEVAYPASQHAGELVYDVAYRMWIPRGCKSVRGVIVHQHGCGVGAWKGAVLGAKDLHWQALAQKWDCALLVPAYQMGEKDNCRLWCDPRHGPPRAADREMFERWRANGAPAGFAVDPRTGHECGDARYLAIAFFKTRNVRANARRRVGDPAFAQGFHLRQGYGGQVGGHRNALHRSVVSL